MFRTSSGSASSPSSNTDATGAVVSGKGSSSPAENHHHHHYHHHHHIHLPILRRRHSTSTSGNKAGGGGAAGRAVTSVSENMSVALNELAWPVDKVIGPAGQLSEALAKRIPHDCFLHILNTSVQDRNRVLVRFLQARQDIAVDAMSMIHNALKWRKTMNIDVYLRKTIQNMGSRSARFPMTVISMPGESKQLVVYGLIKLLDKEKAECTAFRNDLLSLLESAYFSDTYVNDEMIIILYFRDWSIRRNAPYCLVKDGIQTLPNYYPECLARVFLVNYPTTIHAAYTSISPVIDVIAKEKIVWIPDADLSTTLSKYLSPKSTPSFLGGHLKAVFPPEWPDIEAEFAKSKTSLSYGFFY